MPTPLDVTKPFSSTFSDMFLIILYMLGFHDCGVFPTVTAISATFVLTWSNSPERLAFIPSVRISRSHCSSFCISISNVPQWFSGSGRLNPTQAYQKQIEWKR
ncbi:MAG: hypothetical protein IKN56_03115, partial [Clostridia bacterium]|nr:hypothetical protein [Clostridia bacterium]